MIRVDGDEYLTVTEAAEAMWVTRKTISLWIREGLPHISRGRKKLIKRTDLQAEKQRRYARHTATRFDAR